MTQDAIIQIRDLVNCFGVQCVHQGLNLDVKRGEVLGVVGGSVPVNLFCYAVLLGYVVRLTGKFMFLARI